MAASGWRSHIVISRGGGRRGRWLGRLAVALALTLVVTADTAGDGQSSVGTDRAGQDYVAMVICPCEPGI